MVVVLNDQMNAATAGTSAEQPRSVDPGRHYYWLDAFRFACAATVVLVHARGRSFVEFGALPAGQKTALVAAFYALTRVGGEAVVAFFVLSGFLVGGKAIERMREGTFRPGDYAIDRLVRLMLPLAPALLFTALVGLYVNGTVNVAQFVGNLLSLQGVLVLPYSGNGPLGPWRMSSGFISSCLSAA